MTDADRRQVHVIVRGRVQGVGFRYHTLHEATGLQLAGWVKNRTDGAVEAVIEGPPDDVDQMLDWLGHGPGSAHVTGVSAQERPAQGLRGFDVRH